MKIQVAVSKEDNSVLAVGEDEIALLQGEYNVIEVPYNLLGTHDLYDYAIEQTETQLNLHRLPDSKIIERQKQKVNEQSQTIGSMLIESAMDKARISDLETLTGDLILEIATLKAGGTA